MLSSLRNWIWGRLGIVIESLLLSLGLLKLISCPLGGLWPKFGSVVIFSMLGSTICPKVVSGCLVYCGSLSNFVHSSMLSGPNFTWYLRSGFVFFSSLQFCSIDFIVGKSSCGGYIIASASLL